MRETRICMCCGQMDVFNNGLCADCGSDDVLYESDFPAIVGVPADEHPTHAQLLEWRSQEVKP